ncbi:MAG: selenocysteine-specific translation elongation factor [Aggregatilineales bacterium]
MRVIGTAGHVDHGKSTLVQKLTGINPDRLQEEQARKLTIDLGFAWLTLPDSENTIGIVDVPGHRDFIENMLAGVAGIDAVLLVIAADEGIMPQTREHLAILDLLDIRQGLIVMSKVDLIDDPDWLALIELDIQDAVHHTVLQNAPIIPVSAHTGAGIATLVTELSNLLQNLPEHTNYQQPRLPIDRVFSISGAGTVVTGTLSGGTLQVDNTVELQPSSKQGRIRGLQSYKQSVDVALPGSRVAVNISGLDKKDIQRGDVLTYPGQLETTRLIDVYFRHLPDASRPLKHNNKVKFFSGASESIAHVRLLDDEQIHPGQSGWLQLNLNTPLPLTLRDRFILRYPSPPETIGGGAIINPHPAKRWKRFKPEVIHDLETRMEGTPEERITQVITGKTPQKFVHIQQATGFTDDELINALGLALEQKFIEMLPDETFMATVTIQQFQTKIVTIVEHFHEANPLRAGIPRETLRSQMSIKQKLLNMLLEMQNKLQIAGDIVYLNGHEIHFTDTQQQQIDTLITKMNEQPYTPPSYKESLKFIDEPVLRALIERDDIVQVHPDVIFTQNAYQHMQHTILNLIDEQGAIDAKQARDFFGSSRKYIIALLEYLDNTGITKRDGDLRVRGHRTPAANL